MTGRADRSRQRLVQVAVAENPATAQMIQDLLARAGIRSLVKNTNDAAAFMGGGGLPFSLQVFVLEGDASVAAAILADDWPAPPARLKPPRRHE